MALIGLMIAVLSTTQEVPAPLTTLAQLRKAILSDERAGQVPTRPWSLTQASWNATWGQSAFGVGQVEAEDSRAFGFRVPPDSGLRRYAVGSPFLVEGYQDGFPTYGIKRNGDAELCRPLGFVYGSDGLSKNATVFELVQNKWVKRTLARRSKTILARYLNFFDKAKLSDFGTVWYKIVAEGCGTYWVDRDLHCIGPFGTCCRLLPEERSSIEQILAGMWEHARGPIR